MPGIESIGDIMRLVFAFGVSSLFVLFLVIWNKLDHRDQEWVDANNEWWDNPEVRGRNPWES